MDLEPLEEVPLFQPDHGTHRGLSVGRLLALCWRLWWAMLWGSCQCPPLWTLPLGSAGCHTPFQPTSGGGAWARALAQGEGGSRWLPQQVESQGLFWGQQQWGPCGLRLALVRWTALPSPCTLCPSVFASLCGQASYQRCLFPRALCLPLWHLDPSRAWKGVGAHELGGGPAAHIRGCCMVFFLSLC